MGRIVLLFEKYIRGNNMSDNIWEFKSRLVEELDKTGELDGRRLSAIIDYAARKSLTGDSLKAQLPVTFSASQMKGLETLVSKIRGLGAGASDLAVISAEKLSKRVYQAMAPVKAVKMDSMELTLGDAAKWSFDRFYSKRDNDEIASAVAELAESRVAEFRVLGPDLTSVIQKSGNDLSFYALKILKDSPNYEKAVAAVKDFRTETRSHQAKGQEMSLTS
jgi:hypothetical protein